MSTATKIGKEAVKSSRALAGDLSSEVSGLVDAISDRVSSLELPSPSLPSLPSLPSVPRPSLPQVDLPFQLPGGGKKKSRLRRLGLPLALAGALAGAYLFFRSRQDKSTFQASADTDTLITDRA